MVELNKDQIVKFVERFYLNGKIPSAVLQIEDEEIATTAISEQKELRCFVKTPKFKAKDCQIGCYSTGTLLKMLSVLDSRITLDLRTNHDAVINSMMFSDVKGRKVNFATTPIDIINHDGKKGNVKVYDVNIPLNNEVIDDILKAGAAISAETITFLKKKGDAFFAVFNYSTTNTDSIELEIVANLEEEEFEPMSFSLPMVKEILSVNGKRFEEASMDISIKGMLRMYFKDNDESEAEYWLVKLQD